MNTINDCLTIAGYCNTLDYPFDKICVPNKTEDVNLKVFNAITRINDNLTKHIPCK